MHGITALMHFPLSEPLWVSSEQDWDTPSWILLPVFVICFMIAKAAIDIFRDAIDKMVDHSCDAKTEESMRREILKVPGAEEWIFFEPALFGSKNVRGYRDRGGRRKYPLNDAHDIAGKMCIIPSKIKFKRRKSTAWCM